MHTWRIVKVIVLFRGTVHIYSRGDSAKFSCDWGLDCGSHNGAQHGLNQNT